jgi:hypothetical protein
VPSGYYTDSTGQKKALPVNAHSHVLDATQFANVGATNDGSTTDPKEGQGLYWMGGPPNDANPGKWFAGDAPTRAPVNETVLANWFEPTSWNPPNTDNPDGAAGTWRPTEPVSSHPGNIFSWEHPDGFGVPSETVDGYIRLQTTSSITVEWGREAFSGARPIPYGVSGLGKSAGEYTYRIAVLARALKDHTGSTGPWTISVGMAFYSNNVARDDVHAPQPATKAVVWGINRVNITDTWDADTWANIECYMNGRVPVGDLPLDAPEGTAKSWTDSDPDGPHDGYYFCPVIRLEGADADVIIDSVQVFRGMRQLTAPGGVLTTGVTVPGQDYVTTIKPGVVKTNTLELEPVYDVETPQYSLDILEVNNGIGDPPGSTFWQNALGYGWAWPQTRPVVIPGGVSVTANSNPQDHGGQARFFTEQGKYYGKFVVGKTYRVDAVVNGPVGGARYRFGSGFIWKDGPSAVPDGTDQSYTWSFTHTQPEITSSLMTFSIERPSDGWGSSVPLGPYVVKYYQLTEIGDQPGAITGLRDPYFPSDPVTKSYLESLDLGSGSQSVLHVPTTTSPTPADDPDNPFEDGAIWMNPNAPLSVPMVWTVALSSSTNTPPQAGGSVFTDIPNVKRMEFTAPGPGVLTIDYYVTAYVQANIFQHQVGAEAGGGHSEFHTHSSSSWVSSGTLSTTTAVRATAAYTAGGTSIFKAMAFVSAITNGYPALYHNRFECRWTPGAITLTSENPGGSAAPVSHAPLAMVRSANTWAPASANRLPGYQTLDPSVNVVQVSTSCSISGGGTQNGGSRTLTATVSAAQGTPVGSVQFKSGSSVLATVTLTNGSASYSVSSSGTYSASYLGDQSGAYSYQASSSGTTSVTIRQLQYAEYGQWSKWACSYRGNGDYRTDNTQYTYEGYYSSNQGNLISAVGFNRLNVANLHAVTYVGFQATCVHSYNGGGKDMDVGWHNATGGEPGHLTHFGRSERHSEHYIGKGATQSYDITGWAAGVVARSDFGGLLFGSGAAANNAHYGYYNESFYLHIGYQYWA